MSDDLELYLDLAEQGKRIEELEKACAEWAEVSQSNYQRAKAAEAKLAQQDDLVQAAVAAKLREAAECCTAQLRNTAMLMSNPPQSSAAWDARNAILALIRKGGK